MTKAPDRLSVALLALPEATASVLHGMYDMFSSVGRDWNVIACGVSGVQRAAPTLVAMQRKGFRAANGLWIQPDATLNDNPRPDVVCVPDLLVAPSDRLSRRCGPALDWLRACYEGGATVASVCSGAMLLAEAGLLNGRQATTHWAYCRDLQKAFPDIRVCPNQVIVTDGEGHRLVTAGGGASWQDLVLYLVARFFGQDEAVRLAKLYVIDWHHDGQLPFAMLARTRQTEDRAIAACQEWITGHYDEPAPVAAMAALSGMTERSFTRRFTKATGMSPLAYVHALRLEEAKQSLETTDLPVEEIACEVGYEDASFFRRLFGREVGLTPAQYRRKFRPMRKALADGSGNWPRIAVTRPRASAPSRMG